MSDGPPDTLDGWLRYQQRQNLRSIDLGLDRVRAVAGELGLLRPACPVWTVAGTNGKGSTAHHIAALLERCGLASGLFTSPHLVRYAERIRIKGREADESRLLAAFNAIEAVRGQQPLTFFEYNALAALWLFREARVDAIVLEVGLGGRLDATNILDADVAVICSIGLDHTDWLGSTLDAIGAEKAGILRAGKPAIFGSDDLPASVWRRAHELDCRLAVARREFDWQIVGDGRWNFRGRHDLTDLPAPALAGAIQYRNASTAIAAIQALAIEGSGDAAVVGAALGDVQLPGRMQIVPGDVEWLLDVAHNVPAAQVLGAELRKRPHAARTFAVFAALTDKDAAGVVAQLTELIDCWILCGIDEPRGEPAEALRARIGALRGDVQLAATVYHGCQRARALARAGDRVVVFGSFHTVGPALEWLDL